MQRLYLDNGLEVFLKEDHFTNSVCMQCWVGVGSALETEKERGMAHVLEHMLFKGTKKLKVGDFAKIVESSGGNVNAYTTFDRTVYYLNVTSPFAQKGLEILADCIYNSSFDAEELRKEQEVIVEEIKRGLDSPSSRLGYEMFAHTYLGSELGRPVIGSKESVEGFSRQDLVQFHQKWYTPKNLRVLVVGSFNSEEMLGWINTNFGAKKAEPLPELRIERGQFPEKIDTFLVRGDFQQPRLQLVFKGPNLNDSDAILLSLGSFALGSGDLSRFSQRLRDRDGVVANVGAGVWAPHYGGLINFSAFMEESSIFDAIEGILRETFALAYDEPITREELQRAEVNLKCDKYYQEETLEGLAQSFGFGLSTEQKLFYEDMYMAVVEKATPEDITQAWRRWLDPQKMVVGILLSDKSDIDEKAVQLFVEKTAAELSQKYMSHKVVLPKVAMPATTKKAEKYAEVFKLKNGSTFIYRRRPDAKFFNLIGTTEGGSRSEVIENTGISQSASSLLAEATEHLTRDALMRKIEGSGSSLEGFSGKDSLGLSLNCLKEDWQNMSEIFCACMLEPVFPEQQWQTLKRQIAESLKAQEDSPSGQCVKQFQENMFKGHPYSFQQIGNQKSVNSFNTKNLKEFYLKIRDKGPWIFSAVSAMPAQEVFTFFEGLISTWHPQSSGQKIINSSDPFAGAAFSETPYFLEKNREQNHILYGFPGLSWRDKNRATLDVLEKILGGQGGRLFLKLRDEQSLAYSISPIVGYGAAPWAVGAYIACAPKKTEQAIIGMKNEFFALCDAAPTQEEVQSSINYIIGNLELDMQRGLAQARNMALMECYGPGYDDFVTYSQSVLAVTPQKVQALAQQLFDAKRAVTSIVGTTY